MIGLQKREEEGSGRGGGRVAGVENKTTASDPLTTNPEIYTCSSKPTSTQYHSMYSFLVISIVLNTII